jgi:NAD(P)-dependent dehydrogenase (short-subunit alcohol dehydrogenase family)
MNRKIFITGASSGIGRALAFELAARGDDLVLAARRIEAVEAIKQEILRKHPGRTIHARVLDVTRYDDVHVAIDEAAGQLGRLDVVVANAGIGSVGLVGHGHFAEDRAVIETNVIGAMATIDAAVALFRRQNAGQVVVISSVAAARGLPGSGSYSASKAAIAAYAEAARIELYHTPIRVTTLFPGYIDTPINQDMPNRPFLIGVEKGARITADLIDRRVQEATVPVFPWNVMWRLLKVLPIWFLAMRLKPRKI